MRPFMRVSQVGRRRSVQRVGRWLNVAVASLVISTACVEQDDDKPTPEDLKLVKTNILTTAPAVKFPVNADLEGKVLYLGLDVDPPVAVPGKELKLTHYWKSVASPGDGWRLFTHIEGPNHQGFINADHGPVAGKYPVSQWKPGEIIKDSHTITLPASWTHDSVLVYVGLWRGPTRLTIKSGPNDGSGRVLAATIPVKVAAKPEVPRKRYVARRTDKPIKVDGKLDEPAWKDAPSTEPFVNTMTGGPAEQSTQAKLLWDDKFLYVAFENADSDAWGSLQKRDDKLWTEETVELMIDADRNGKSYVEIQVAPNGTVFDTYLPTYRKYEDSIDPKKKPFSWDSKITAKVVVDGTLNKREDKDKGWTVELALPLGDVKGLEPTTELTRLPPVLGDSWRINMFRLDIPRAKGQLAWGWSPPLVGDFHVLDRFGDLIFGDEKGNITPPAVAVASGEKATKSDKAGHASRRKGSDRVSKPTGGAEAKKATP